jgi:hypothetical protein
MADTSLILGLAGIAGVVLAGSIGPVTQWTTERAKRRDAARGAAENVLRAVRMIDLELGEGQLTLIRAVASRGWFPAGQVPRFDEWEKFSSDVAGAVSPSNWRTLVHAHSELSRVVRMYEALSAVDPEREP